MTRILTTHKESVNWEIKRRLAPLIHLKGLKIPHKDAIIKVLDLYGSYMIDFEDCLSIAHMKRQQVKEIYSYDRDFGQVTPLTRKEPAAGDE